MRDSTMMYRTQIDALRGLPAEQFKTAVLAIWDYELDGKEPDDPIASFAVGMAKPLIDRRNAHYESGKKGGRPKAEKPNENQTEPNDNQIKPNCNQTEPNETVKDKGERIKDKYPYKDIVEYLNQKAGTAFRASSEKTQALIRARMNEDFTIDDFKKVIDGRVTAWKGTDMEQYLRPSTLFGNKFEGYLNAKPGNGKNTFNNFTSRVYDFDELERKLTGVM